MIDLNISQIQEFMKCPRRWYYRYVLKRSARGEAAALRIGTAWHKLMEDMPRWANPTGDDLDICVSRLTDDEWEHDLFTTGALAFAQWVRDNPDHEFKGFEMEMNVPFGQDSTTKRYRLFGKLDALVKWNGKFWHMQHKTLAPNKSIGHYTTAVRRSFHEYAYRRMCEENGYYPYGGTILVILRKVKDPQKAAPLVPPIYLATQDSADRWRHLSLVYWCNRIDELQNVQGGYDEVLVPQNPDNCYTWSLCEYVDICDGKRSIEDVPGKDPLGHYKAPA